MAKKSLIRARSQSFVFECNDSEERRINAIQLIQGDQPRDPEGLASRLAIQFVDQNQGILSSFDIKAENLYDGKNSWVVFKTGLKIGAFPLISPTSGKPEYGMVVKPRFEWIGVGNMLASMGWRIVPTLLNLPLLPGTERKVPTWVLSSVILTRIKSLLDQLERRFELYQSVLIAPKGTVNWNEYATRRMPSAQFLQLLCTYPDLRDDQKLKAAIHFTLRKQLSGLESQRSNTGIVLPLIELCQSLIRKVANTLPLRPSNEMILAWINRPLRLETFREGIQAIDWTLEDRGLAGLSDIQGLPWILPMDSFFEAWLETVVFSFSRQIGGTLQVGRKQETTTPIHWEHAILGTQKYLVPDVILEREDLTVIFDAKYKRHWEEFSSNNWSKIEKEIQEQHRQDLLQVLAYSSIHSKKRVVACLVYPCNIQTWESLKSRNRIFERASIPTNGRDLEVILVAIPMNGKIENAADAIRQALFNHLN